MTWKTTIGKAQVGDEFYIRRGRSVERLGTLVAKEKRRGGLYVRFEFEGEPTYNGFAGYATVVLRKV